MLKFSSVLEESISEGSVNMLCIEGGQDTRILYPKNANTPRVRKHAELSSCFVYGVFMESLICLCGVAQMAMDSRFHMHPVS